MEFMPSQQTNQQILLLADQDPIKLISFIEQYRPSEFKSLSVVNLSTAVHRLKKTALTSTGRLLCF